MQTRTRSLGPIVSAMALTVFAAIPVIAHAQSSCSPEIAGPGCPVFSPKTTQILTNPSSTPVAQAASLWVAKRDASLRDLLSQWSAKAGWQEPTWNLKPEDDFTLGASMDFEGNFSGAVTALFDAFPAEAKLRVRLYTPNRLMIVEQAP